MIGIKEVKIMIEQDTYNGQYVDVTKEQSDLGFSFIEALKNDDLISFWSLVCELDKSRVYGIYYSLKNEQLFLGEFEDFVRTEIFEFVKEKYKNVFDNTGIASHLRFSEFGEHIIFMVPNTVAPVHFIAEAEIYVFPITILPEIKMNKMDSEVSWKARIYNDRDFMI